MKDSTYKKYCLMIDHWFINGFNGTKTYIHYYPDCEPSTARINFSKILTNTNIQEYIEQKHENTSTELNITLLSQLKRLDDIIDSKEERSSDKVNAIKEQNKLLALYEEHNRQKKSDLISDKVTINFKNKK